MGLPPANFASEHILKNPIKTAFFIVIDLHFFSGLLSVNFIFFVVDPN